MYAIIRTGGKQYTVKPGDVLHVEKLDQELGSEFDISDVLYVGGDTSHVGQPTVKNAKVTVVVTKQAKARKVIVFKKKRRHSFRKFHTHRQMFTEIFVKSITSPNGEVEKTDQEPNVVDVAAMRIEHKAQKQAARKAAVAKTGPKEEVSEAKVSVKKAVKKKVVKAAPKKTATKAAKKKAGAKKSTKTKKATGRK